MAASAFIGFCEGLARSLRWLFALDRGPANLAEEVADRLFDPLLPDERALLRLRFGVDPATNDKLEEIARKAGLTRWRRRRLEGKVLVALVRWDYRRRLLPKVHRRLVERIAAADDEILKCLCDAPAVRHVLVGWHDSLVGGQCAAGEIGDPPDRPAGDDPDGEPQSPEILLAGAIRRALWANARSRKAIARPNDRPCSHGDAIAVALDAFRALGLNANAIRDLADALLAPARRVESGRDAPATPMLDPVVDPETTQPAPPRNLLPRPARETPDFEILDPALVESVVAQAGMPLEDLWSRAARIRCLSDKAGRNRRMLVDSCMPLVAEVAVEKGLRDRAFLDAIETGRAAVQRLAEGCSCNGEHDFAAQAKRAARTAIGDAAPAENRTTGG